MHSRAAAQLARDTCGFDVYSSDASKRPHDGLTSILKEKSPRSPTVAFAGHTLPSVSPSGERPSPRVPSTIPFRATINAYVRTLAPT